MPLKICIATTFDRNYKLGGRTLLKSIRRHTDCKGIDFKVITADPLVAVEFGGNNCHLVTEEIDSGYKNVCFAPFCPESKYMSSWYRYEVFNFTEYDRVICIDSDCICVRDISYLFSEELDEFDLVSVEDYIVSKNFVNSLNEIEELGCKLSGLRKRLSEGKVDIQTAVFVANKRILNGDWYKRLLEYANSTEFTYSVDQGILNDFIYMEDLKIKLLPLEWNFQDIYEIECPKLPVPENPIIVHCQESKPFIKQKCDLKPDVHKWHDLWWSECNHE